MQSVALLDVDHTLLDINDAVNDVLLEALLAQNIVRVYLFTDMTFNQHVIEERNDLVKHLEQMGFSVQGIITPNDLTWSQMNSGEVLKLHHWCFVEKLYRGKLYGKEFEDFVASKKAELPGIYDALIRYQPSIANLGESYNETCLELFHHGSVSETTQVRSIFAKVFADHLSEKFGYKHNKGLLLDAFLRHKPTWVSGVIVFDDNKSVAEDVQSFKPVAAEHVSESNDAQRSVAVPPITMVPVTSTRLQQEYYDVYITQHLAKV